MDPGDVGIISAIVTVALAVVGIGLSIRSILGNRFDRLSKEIEGLDSRLREELVRINNEIQRVESRISGELSQTNSLVTDVESRLRGELSGMHSEISQLREQNIMREIARIKRLEDEMHSIQGLAKLKKGR